MEGERAGAGSELGQASGEVTASVSAEGLSHSCQIRVVAMAAAALVQGLAGALLTPGAFVMVATLAAAAIVVWTRRPLPGLIVAA